jgi:hypothetical protein
MADRAQPASLVHGARELGWDPPRALGASLSTCSHTPTWAGWAVLGHTRVPPCPRCLRAPVAPQLLCALTTRSELPPAHPPLARSTASIAQMLVIAKFGMLGHESNTPLLQYYFLTRPNIAGGHVRVPKAQPPLAASIRCFSTRQTDRHASPTWNTLQRSNQRQRLCLA